MQRKVESSPSITLKWAPLLSPLNRYHSIWFYYLHTYSEKVSQTGTNVDDTSGLCRHRRYRSVIDFLFVLIVDLFLPSDLSE